MKRGMLLRSLAFSLAFGGTVMLGEAGNGFGVLAGLMVTLALFTDLILYARDPRY